jgi:hypothetical protein
MNWRPFNGSETIFSDDGALRDAFRVEHGDGRFHLDGFGSVAELELGV